METFGRSYAVSGGLCNLRSSVSLLRTCRVRSKLTCCTPHFSKCTMRSRGGSSVSSRSPNGRLSICNSSPRILREFRPLRVRQADLTVSQPLSATCLFTHSPYQTTLCPFRQVESKKRSQKRCRFRKRFSGLPACVSIVRTNTTRASLRQER